MELATAYRYLNPSARVFSGAGAISEVHREAQRLGAKRAFVVCSRTVATATDLLEKVKSALGDLYAGVFDQATRESPIPSVMAGVEAAKEAQAGLIIAVGGGSAVGTARAITIALGEGKTVYELCATYPPDGPPVSPRLTQPKLPIFAVLTTPTTAVDRGGVAVMDDKPPHRLELFDPKVRPTAIFLDSDALLTAPFPLFRDTSATTFCQTISALQSPRLNPFNQADLRQVLEQLLTYLPRLVQEPDDGEVRIQLAVTAILANRAADAPSSRGQRVSNNLDHQLLFQYDHVRQGASLSALVHTEMRRNRDGFLTGQARLAEFMGVRAAGSSDERAADAAAAAVGEFLRSIGMPTRLRDLGITREDFQALVEREIDEPAYMRGPEETPIAGDLLGFLEEAW